MEEQTIYQDNEYHIFEDPEEGLMLNYHNSCRYKIAGTESSIIRYLCGKISELSEKK